MGRSKKNSAPYSPPKPAPVLRAAPKEEKEEVLHPGCPYCKSEIFTETKDHPQGELRFCECGKWSLDQNK